MDKNNFSDLAPIPQDDGPNPIVPIAYSDEYSSAMGYMRRILQNGEFSTRAFDLTTEILNMNPAHYSIWKFRQDLLKHLNVDFNVELEYATSMADEHPKNYQIWHHRQVIMESIKTPNPTEEITFINSMLDSDSKNYHAWSYRKWVISHFNLWDTELQDMDLHLSRDIRNNSAWNHRFYCVKHQLEQSQQQQSNEDIISSEINYTLSKILVAPNNESAWNYLRGIINRSQKPVSEYLPTINTFIQTLFDQQKEHVTHALSLQLDLLESQISQQENAEERSTLLTEAFKYCDLLIQNDTVRRNYWNYRKGAFIELKFSGKVQTN
ncbi:hypothetical protein HDU76_013939 [Blyttiomyces sp. JEL0837]|nr:hypothetical protein HDU76_013939 [Blyttiomyces sp. JEL0837]